MTAEATITPSTPGGEIGPTFNMELIQYYAGTPGTSYLPPGQGCPESAAMEAGGAVTYVKADKHCQLVQGIRITIGDTAESIHSGFELVNLNFHCNGTQASVSSNMNLRGPMLV